MASGIMAPVAKMFLERVIPPTNTSGVEPAKGMDDASLTKLVKDCKKEAFDKRWVWERTWMRNIHYVSNRHWITYVRQQNQWVDVKLAKWIPKPVVNMIADGVQALRAMFEGVELDVYAQPVGGDAKNVAVAAVADDYSPILHKEHDMPTVMNEADYWFVVCGNVWLYTFYERHIRHGVNTVDYEQCVACGQVYTSDKIAEAEGACPHCGATEFQPAVDEQTGQPMAPLSLPKGKGVTLALSPFEVAFPNNYARFEDVPYVIRMRWRRKEYFTEHPVLSAQVAKFNWSKAPSETSMQLFRSLPQHSDLGVSPFIGSSDVRSGTSDNDEEGTVEYELSYRPCGAYPQGLVVRWIGEANVIILHDEENEAYPGELPYKDVKGNALFTYTHAPFEQRGGRVYGTSPLDAAIPMQNILNQIWSFMLMIVNRVANPLWMIPKGSEIEKFTGAPGLVVKWNPLTVGGQAKPERVDGANIPATVFTLEEKVRQNIEERMGTFDLLKGTKPAGVDAFAAMQLLVERSQSRFSSAFKARGRMYRDWNQFALEIEREFGEDRIQQVMSPARSWVEKIFKVADLQGSFTIIVEDGSQTPKTTLGRRAAIEHLNQLGFLDPADPDQKYKVLQEFGQSRLAPTLDIHVQRALCKQQAFEDWANDPQQQQMSMVRAEQGMMDYQQKLAAVQPPEPPPPQIGPDGLPMPPDPVAERQAMQAALPKPPSPAEFTPLAWKPWYNPVIHKQEFMKWANGDSVQMLLQQNPKLEAILIAHLADIEMAEAELMARMAGPAPGGPPQRKPGGAGRAMQNSNQEAGGVQTANSQ